MLLRWKKNSTVHHDGYQVNNPALLYTIEKIQVGKAYKWKLTSYRGCQVWFPVLTIAGAKAIAEKHFGENIRR